MARIRKEQITSGAATDGYVLTADGAGNTDWEEPAGGPGAVDAADVTFTPADNTDWDSSADPGDVNDALDQLAARVTDIVAGGGGAPTTAKYIVAAADGGLSAEVVKQYLGDNYDPNTYPGSPNALDDEFEGGGSVDAKWTKTNDPAGADALNQTDFTGYLHVGLLELGTDNFDNLVRLHQTPPAGTATMEYVARLAITATGLGAEHAEFAEVCVYLGDSVNDQFVAAGVQLNNADGATDVSRGDAAMDNGTGGLALMTTTQVQHIGAPGTFVYVKLQKATADAYTSANTYNAYMSANGMIWFQIGTCSKTFTGACDEVGLFFRRPKSQTGTPKAEAMVDFFRRAA